MNGLLKRRKLVCVCICALLLVVIAVILITHAHKNQSIETVTIYYQQKNDAGACETKAVTPDEKSAQKIQEFLNQLKYNEYADSTILPDVNQKSYAIRGKHKGSSTLDFNNHIYIRKDHYIVMNAFSYKYALDKHSDYDFLKSFLFDGNLSSFQAASASQ